MPTNKILFLSDQPVEIQRDFLWGIRRDSPITNDDIVEQIGTIAQRLVDPLIDKEIYPDHLSDSMTFAVLGHWGSGKSSFLRMLKNRVEEIAERNFGTNFRQRIGFCEFIAPSYVTSVNSTEEIADIRTALTMRVLMTFYSKNAEYNLEESRSLAYQAFKKATSISTSQNDQFNETKELKKNGEDSEDDQNNKYREAGGLLDIAKKLAQFIDFPDFLANELNGKGESGLQDPTIMIVIIDELDRAPHLIPSILSIIQQWSKVKNLFFIISVNREVLLEGVQKSPVKLFQEKPEYALEKYVQHIVEIPDLAEETLKIYIKQLLKESIQYDPVAQILSDDTSLLLLEKGLKNKTPRAAKRYLNAIIPCIRVQLDPIQKAKISKNISSPSNEPATVSQPALSADNREIQLIIKEQILKYSWSQFARDFFDHPSRAWQELETACSEYVVNAKSDKKFGSEKLKKELERIKHLHDNETFLDHFPNDDRSLIVYLAEKPLWTEEGGGKDKSSSAQLGNINFVPQENVDEKFMRTYVSSSAASMRNEASETFKAIQEAYQVAKDYTTNGLPTHRADEVGNLALRAESLRANDFADSLYQLALQMKPEHPQNMQNYVSFIGDTVRKERFSIAEDLLTQLEVKYPDFKPGRTLSLKAQIANLTNKSFSLTEDQIHDIFESVVQNPRDASAFAAGLRLLGQVARDYSAMKQFAIQAVDSLETAADVYSRIRYFADLASSEDTAQKDAMEIYRRLLANTKYIVDPDDVADVQHNYANSLYRADYDDEAGKLWYEAYQTKPQDTNIRNAYASYLLRANRPDVAQQVNASQPISEKLSERLLQPVNQIMPDRFSDAEFIHVWFEKLDTLLYGSSEEEIQNELDAQFIDESDSSNRSQTSSEVLPNLPKELGLHPDDGKPVSLCNDSKGLYIKHSRRRARVPKGTTSKEITLEVALKLLRK
ncbi:MAG: hypothetical protein B0A82_02685 [Alkalinema sp. CACIAM 70d]|nr:MAG: hypothetical protein B0A82_02685 [Alkalinema sp. CACIAM 70d]